MMANQIICPNCGRRNAAHRHVCRTCQTVLAPEWALNQDRRSEGPLNSTEMALISLAVALILACFTGFGILNYGNWEADAPGSASSPERLLLVCPVSLSGLIGSVLIYQFWWRDRSRSYVLLGILLLLVLAGGLTFGWLIVSLLASA